MERQVEHQRKCQACKAIHSM